MKEKLSKKQAGITLVALVVTIVVLLILAGITIMYTMGENGIFKKKYANDFPRSYCFLRSKNDSL